MKKSIISIEPYFDPEMPNMGFERYGLSTAPGAELTEYVSKDVNGRYVTGLDLDSPSVMYLEDKEDKEAREQEIVEVVARLERVFGGGQLDARNEKMWQEFNIKLTHFGKDLDPTNPKDEILIHSIKAGGFTGIAPNLEKAKEGDYKYYLRQVNSDSDLTVERKRSIARAKGELSKMDSEDSHKMYLVAKALLNPNNEFTPSTPKGILFDKLDQFIEGTIVKDNKKGTVKQFLDTCKQDKETLYIQGLVKDALYFFIITRDSDGYFYNKETEARAGKNEKEIVKYLSNPVHQLDLENVKARVEAKLGN